MQNAINDQNTNAKNRFLGMNRSIQIDPNIFRTSPTGYSYIFGGGGIVARNRANRRGGLINGNIFRDLWTLISSPVN